jgi:phosphoglycerate dehydrogenase-like enzyme
MSTNRRIRAAYMQQFAKDELFPLLSRHPSLDIAAARNAAELRDILPGAELLIANNRFYDEEVGRIVMAHGKDIRWIQVWTAGIERGIRFGMPRGIPVCAAPGVKGPTVAEHAMTLLLASFRRLRDIEQARTRRDWIRDRLHETARTLEDATIVIVGFGAIGHEIAR